MSLAIIVRGLPGSGKTTWVTKQFEDRIMSGEMIYASADDYFYTDISTTSDGRISPKYEFDPTLLPQAHAACQKTFIEALRLDKSVILDNTFSQLWEYENYVLMALSLKYTVTIISMLMPEILDEAKLLFNRQKHGVPLDSFLAMWWRWEKDLNETVIQVGNE